MWEWLKLLGSLSIWKEKFVMDLTQLETRVAALEVVVPNIESDYATLAAEIEALKAQLDPTAQARLDEMVTRLGVSIGRLSAKDATVEPSPPPPPPPPPPPVG
jgi:hypothetical protein